MSLPIYDDEILAAISAHITAQWGTALIFDGPPTYDVDKDDYPFAVVQFEDMAFARSGGGGTLKSITRQEQTYSISCWLIREVTQDESLWTNLRHSAESLKTALEGAPTLGGACTWLEVRRIAPDNAVTEWMRSKVQDVAAVRLDVEVTCLVSE